LRHKYSRATISLQVETEEYLEAACLKHIALTDSDYERVVLLARAWEISEGEVVRRLLDRFVTAGDDTDEESAPDDAVPIYADYEGTRVEALYHPTTKRVEITSGVLKSRSYKSPSGAAIGVVQALNPNVHPNRNGWSFWFVAENGQTLQTIRSR
jgi:hypothetical protein